MSLLNPENRGHYDRSKLRYPSDLTDAEWALAAPLILRAKRSGNKRTVDVREIIDGITYILGTGCLWAEQPKVLRAAAHGMAAEAGLRASRRCRTSVLTTVFDWHTNCIPSVYEVFMRINSTRLPEPPQANVSLAAYEQLRGKLLSGALPGGSVIQERRLAEELGFSRTPVREALQRLEGEGLLRREDRFLRVLEVTVTGVMEILAVRQSLEGDATRAACGRIPKETLAGIRARIEAMADPGAVSDDGHWGVDDLVHLSIAQASGNSLLLCLISELRQKTRLFGLHRIPSRFGPGKAEHLAILDALEAEDADAAVAQMRAHIANARQAILAALAMGRA